MAKKKGERPIVMRQNWRDLLFVHWGVPLAALQPLIPAGLKVDTFEGQAYVAIVPFTIRDMRLPGLPSIPGLAHMHEVNVRTYVRAVDGTAGVWFFSLDASSRLAVAAARKFYKLPYQNAEMSMNVNSGWIDYASKRTDQPRATLRMRYRQADEPPRTAAAGTLEYFLLERYVLFAQQGERLYRARVHHSPYQFARGEMQSLHETLLAAASIPRPINDPLLHFSGGVDVSVEWIGEVI